MARCCCRKAPGAVSLDVAHTLDIGDEATRQAVVDKVRRFVVQTCQGDIDVFIANVHPSMFAMTIALAPKSLAYKEKLSANAPTELGALFDVTVQRARVSDPRLSALTTVVSREQETVVIVRHAVGRAPRSLCTSCVYLSMGVAGLLFILWLIVHVWEWQQLVVSRDELL